MRASIIFSRIPVGTQAIASGGGEQGLVDFFAVQVAFLLFESIFCFISAIVSAAKNSRDAKAKHAVVFLNVLAGLLLLFDYLTYVLPGRVTPFSSFVMRASTLAVFLICDLFLVAIIIYISIVLFGHFDLKREQRCRFRFLTCCMLSVVGMAMVIISHFSGLYYTIDANNNYNRGELFPLSVLIPVAGMAIILSILMQYRKETSRSRFLALLSYIIFPLVGFLFQYFFYGFAYMDIGVAISVHVMFVENILYQNQQIRIAERTDIRTGLANEHGCIEWIRTRKSDVNLEDYAAVYFDLAKYTLINRKYGVDVGNQILSSYAGAFAEKLEPDEFMGHQTGDQFIAIVRKENLPKILELMKGLPVNFKDETGEIVTESIAARAGVYEIDKKDIKGEEVVTYCRTALDHARSLGSKQVVYMTQELMNAIEDRKRFDLDIRYALEHDEFVPFYQPKVNSKTNMVCGAEALARWIHKDRIIDPGDFIPFMERNESICDLDMYMLRKICADITQWRKEGMEIPPISVNFSRRNLADPDLAKKIDKVVKESGIPKELIEIEITETVDEFPLSTLKEFVDSLRALGYGTSIDDFGCGNSSMSVLREINFDTMKIDKGFIDRDDVKDQTILDHIIKLAIDIGLKIVAEGVEQSAQVETLKNLGANVIQGYFYDRPLPKEKMFERLKNPKYEMDAETKEKKED